LLSPRLAINSWSVILRRIRYRSLHRCMWTICFIECFPCCVCY